MGLSNLLENGLEISLQMPRKRVLYRFNLITHCSYVEHIIITRDDYEEINFLKQLLAGQFQLKDLGPFRYFLGMEVARSKSGIVISLRNYILDLLQSLGMLGSRSAKAPILWSLILNLELKVVKRRTENITRYWWEN